MTEPKLSDLLERSFARCRNLEVPLGDRLQAFANEVRRLVPHFQTAVDSLVTRLASSNAGATAPKVGEPMPAFLLPDEQGRLVRLEDLLGDGPVALAFNRGHWCPYCRINVEALARAQEEVAAERRRIAAIVPDRQRFAVWLKSDAKAPFPVLTDMNNGYAMALGLATYVGDEVKQMMVSSGFDPSVSQEPTIGCFPFPPPSSSAPAGSSARFCRSGLPHAHGDRGLACRTAVRCLVAGRFDRAPASTDAREVAAEAMRKALILTNRHCTLRRLNS